MSCTGVTYPNDKYTITGSVPSWEMNVEVNGKKREFDLDAKVQAQAC